MTTDNDNEQPETESQEVAIAIERQDVINMAKEANAAMAEVRSRLAALLDDMAETQKNLSASISSSAATQANITRELSVDRELFKTNMQAIRARLRGEIPDTSEATQAVS